MKKRGRIASISLRDHIDVLALLNKTVGASAGSSKKELLLPRIYRKWKTALPDLENAPLFKVVGRKKRYDDSMEKVYGFSDGVKDSWANLFEYKGSHENVRLRFSVDRLKAGLDDVIIVYGGNPELTNAEAWENFIANLYAKLDSTRKLAQADETIKESAIPLQIRGIWLRAIPSKWLWLSLCALILSIAGLASFVAWKINLFAPPVEVVSVEETILPLTGKPSIAVLPFRNLDDDRRQDYFCDGMTDDIITDLSKISGMSVISRSSSFTYKGQIKKISEIAKELKVRYILEGSVRRSGDLIRINAQLIDAKTDHHIWAERFDDTFNNIFELQDKITAKILSAFALRLSTQEQQKIADKGTHNLAAYDAYLKGMDHRRKFTPSDYSKAIRYFREAIKLDPNYSQPNIALAFTFWDTIFGGKRFYHEIGIGFTFSRILARYYLQASMKKPTSQSYQLMALMELWKRNYKESINYAEKAVAFSPNSADALANLGLIQILTDKPKIGIKCLKKAIMLDPLHQTTLGIGIAYFCMGKFEEAVQYIDKGVTDKPEMIPFYAFSAAANAFIGNNTKAMEACEKWLNNYRKPGPRVQMLYYLYACKNVSVFDSLIKGLIKAGYRADALDYYTVDKDQKLSGQEIRKLLLGKTQVGTFLYDTSRTWSIYRSEGGEIESSKYYGGTDKGKSWIKDNEICDQYEFRYSAIKYCGDIYRNKKGDEKTISEYLFVTDFGIIPFTVK
jgi:TolB-like protein